MFVYVNFIIIYKMRLELNGRYFADYLLKCIFSGAKFSILIQISFRYVTIGSDKSLVRNRRQVFTWATDDQ